MVNKANMLLWAEACESGEYEQARGVLHQTKSDMNETGYCCLGVACEVAIKNGVELKREIRSDSEEEWEAFDGESVWLPMAVANWLGLPIDWGASPHNPKLATKQAAYWNDSERLSLPEIGRLIRTEYVEAA